MVYALPPNCRGVVLEYCCLGASYSQTSVDPWSFLLWDGNVRWPCCILHPDESRWVCRRDRQTDGHQTVTLRFPLDAASVIISEHERWASVQTVRRWSRNVLRAPYRRKQNEVSESSRAEYNAQKNTRKSIGCRWGTARRSTSVENFAELLLRWMTVDSDSPWTC